MKKETIYKILSVVLLIAAILFLILWLSKCGYKPGASVIHSDTTYITSKPDTLTDTLHHIQYIGQKLSKDDSIKIYNLFASKEPMDTGTFNLLLDYYTERTYDTIARNDSIAKLRLMFQTYMNRAQLIGYELTCNQQAQQIINNTTVNNFKNRLYLGMGVNYFNDLYKYPLSFVGSAMFVNKKNLAIAAEIDPLKRDANKYKLGIGYIGIRGYWKLQLKKK